MKTKQRETFETNKAGAQLMNRLEWTFIEDRALLEGASKEKLRALFDPGPRGLLLQEMTWISRPSEAAPRRMLVGCFF